MDLKRGFARCGQTLQRVGSSLVVAGVEDGKDLGDTRQRNVTNLRRVVDDRAFRLVQVRRLIGRRHAGVLQLGLHLAKRAQQVAERLLVRQGVVVTLQFSLSVLDSIAKLFGLLGCTRQGIAGVGRLGDERVKLPAKIGHLIPGDRY